MKSIALVCCLTLFSGIAPAQTGSVKNGPTVRTENGLVEGTLVSGISLFRGIPYAEPPVGEARWKEPRPVKNWEGTRKAISFGPRPMQGPIFKDMQFRSDTISEDCLYLNIWTPARGEQEGLPVLVYFYGGGLKAGDGSEYRYDGESMARRGIVMVTVNYRLGIFGFLAHPDLSRESIHHVSGNYGLMDQTEALRWVHKNISVFGGNPDRITIAGESAGAESVNAQMVSPLSRNLFAAAIGESGSVLEMLPVVSLAEAEKTGAAFGDSLGAHSIGDLRSMPAEQLLKATAKPGSDKFPVAVDGYFFPEQPLLLYRTGRAARVPLLVGWNSEEAGLKNILGNETPTMDNYFRAVKKLFPSQFQELLKYYTVKNDSDVSGVATALASDIAHGFGCWRWAEWQAKSNNPVYRYFFTKPRPGTRTTVSANQTGMSPVSATNISETKSEFVHGAAHATEIEYALGNLPGNRVYDWGPDDYRISAVMQDYFINFIKTKNPNGIGLPYWPIYQPWQKNPVLHIGLTTERAADTYRDRYLFLEKISLNH